MKQIWPDYSYSPTTNVLTLTGLNIDRDQLLLVSAPERGRIMYNFADSTVTASAFTAGANTALTLVATTAGLTTTASLVIYYDDQLQSTSVSISNFPATQPISIASVTIGSIPAISGTVTANLFAERVGAGSNEPTNLQCDSNGFLITSLYRNGSDAVNYDPVAGNVSVNVKNVSSVTIGSIPAISGTVTANVAGQYFDVATGDTAQLVNPVYYDGEIFRVSPSTPLPVALATGSGYGASVTIGSLPAISGTVTAVNHQGTTVTTSNFTSTTASTQLAAANAGREVLTIFNEGAGNLHICAGATCTTIAYQVRLSAGDYYEVPLNQTSLTHSAVFATAGTARVTQIS